MKNFKEIRNEWFIQQVNKLEDAGLNRSDIARRMSVKPQYLTPFFNPNDKRRVSEKFIQKFCAEFNVNHNDLLNRMKKYEQTPLTEKITVSEPEVEYIQSDNTKNVGIPLIPLNAMAGFGTGEIQILEHECERYVVPMFKEAQFLIPVKGSSMIPKYNSGDLVACRKIPLDTFFQWNKVYVLDTEQGAIIKRVKKGTDNNHILIVSDNPTYEPFELSLEKIHAIAVVVGVIRLE